MILHRRIAKYLYLLKAKVGTLQLEDTQEVLALRITIVAHKGKGLKGWLF